MDNLGIYKQKYTHIKSRKFFLTHCPFYYGTIYRYVLEFMCYVFVCLFCCCLFIAKQYYYVLIPHFSPLLLFPGPVSFIRKSTFSRKWHYRHKWTAIDIRLHMCFSVDKSWLPTKWACDCFLYYEQRLTSIQTVKLLCLDL